MVMAWERFSDLHYKRAYCRMFRKFIRNHVPMELFDYTIRNYLDLSLAPYDFIEIINSKLNEIRTRENQTNLKLDY